MALAEIQKGHVGLEIEIGFVLADGSPKPIDGSTTREITIEKAGGTRIVVPAVYTTDGTDGLMKYVCVDGDINISGGFRAQGYCVKPGPEKFYSSIFTFVVLDNLGAAT